MSAPSPEVVAALSHPSVVPLPGQPAPGFNIANVGALSGSVLQAPVVPQAPPDNGYASGLPPLGVPVPQPQQAPPPAVAAPSPEEQAIAAASVPAAQPVAGGGRAAAPAAAPVVNPLNSPQTAAADARIAGTEAVANAQEGEQQTTEASAAETAARNQLAADAQRKLTEQHEARTAAEQRVQLLREKASKAEYHSFWQDKSAGQMVLAGLGILAGGVNWDPHHQNQAVELIQSAIKQEFQQQEAQHAQLWKDVEAAMQQGQQLSSDQLREMGDFRAQQALKLDAVIAKGREMVAANKAHGETLALKQQLSQLEFNREHALDESTRLHQAAEETKRHNRAEEGLGYARLGVEKAKSGGDGMDLKSLQLAEQLATATRKSKAAAPLNTAEDRLEQARAALATMAPGPDGKVNQLSAYEGLMGYVRSVAGGKPTKEQAEAIIGQLGGVGDQVKRRLQQLVSSDGGKITPRDAQLIQETLNHQIGVRVTEVNYHRKRQFDNMMRDPLLGRIPEQQRAAIISRAGFAPEQADTGAPAAAPAAGGFTEGQTATGPGGKRIVYRGGKWQPL